jgi:hypothetical protein
VPGRAVSWPRFLGLSRQSGNLLQDGRPQRSGQVVAHARVSDQSRAGNGLRRSPAAFGTDYRVLLAVDDERRYPQARQRAAPVTGRDNRGALAGVVFC